VGGDGTISTVAQKADQYRKKFLPFFPQVPETDFQMKPNFQKTSTNL